MSRTGRVRTVLLALAVAVVALLAGCGSVPIDTPAPSQELVLAYVSDKCPNEAFELVGSEQVSELPEKVVYTFRSTERDLTFTATSEITEPTYSLFPVGPKPSISCDYSSVVRDLYHDAALARLAELCDSYGDGAPLLPDDSDRLYVTNYRQLEAAMEMIARVDEVYVDEFAFNDAQWVRENASTSLSVCWFDGSAPEEGASRPDNWEHIGYVAMFGELDAADARDKLARAYAQMVVDNSVPADKTLPKSYLEGLHRTNIDCITVRGEEVPFGLGETNWGDATNPYQRDHISEGGGVVARWSDERGCYLVRVNMDGTDPRDRDESGSWLVQQVAQLAGGSYEKDATGFSWEVGDVRGHMEYVGMENDRKVARLELNGRISTVSCSTEEAGLYDAVAMPVDDFAALFGLTASVDEAEGVIALA